MDHDNPQSAFHCHGHGTLAGLGYFQVAMSKKRKKDLDPWGHGEDNLAPSQGSICGLLFPSSQEKHRLGSFQAVEGKEDSLHYRADRKGFYPIYQEPTTIT